MNKIGIICNIEKGRYYVLTEQGDFIMHKGCPPAGMKPGDRINLASRRQAAGATFPRTWLRSAAIVAALVLVVITSLQLLPGTPAQAGYRLALDINPSLEVIYDDDYQVLEWSAFNEDGQGVLQDLDKPKDLFSALKVIFARCVELGLVKDEQDIFITADSAAPLDSDRLLGALEGHGAAVKLHVVRLPKNEYKTESGSPLRGYLNRKTGAGLNESAPVAATALSSLDAELVTSVEVMPWHNNPIVQAFIEKYLVSGRMVEEMIETGLSSDEIANLLELAQADKISPGDIFKQLKDSGLSPGQFLNEHESPGTAKGPNMAVPEWLPDLLAREFDHSAGQLSSYLNKGVELADLETMLVLEALGGNKLQILMHSRESFSIQELVRDSGVDSGQVDQYRQRVLELVQIAATWADNEDVAGLSAECKVAKAEVLYVLGRGYGIDEAGAIIRSKSKGNASIKQHLNEWEGSQGGDTGSGNAGDSGKEPGQPGSENSGQPEDNNGNPPDSPPGQSKGKGNG